MFDFNSRETYLTYRATWKQNYQRLSEESRSVRKAFRAAQRTAAKFYKAEYPTTGHSMSEEESAFWSVIGDINQVRKYQLALKKEATEALEELAKAKVEAQRQWLARTTRPVVIT